MLQVIRRFADTFLIYKKILPKISRKKVFFKKGVLKNFAKFTEKHLTLQALMLPHHIFIPLPPKVHSPLTE